MVGYSGTGSKLKTRDSSKYLFIKYLGQCFEGTYFKDNAFKGSIFKDNT